MYKADINKKNMRGDFGDYIYKREYGIDENPKEKKELRPKIEKEFESYADEQQEEFERNNPMKNDGFRQINEDVESSRSDSEESEYRRRGFQFRGQNLDPERNNLRFQSMAKYKALLDGEI